MRHRKKIRIDHPSHGQWAEATVEVRGVVSATENVQIMVLSADDRWYRQEKPKILKVVNGLATWCATAHIGDPLDPQALQYTIAAFTGERIEEESIPCLPIWRPMALVNVRRRRPQ